MWQRKRTWRRICEFKFSYLHAIYIYITYMWVAFQDKSVHACPPKELHEGWAGGALLHGVGGAHPVQLLPGQGEVYNLEVRQVQRSKEPGDTTVEKSEILSLPESLGFDFLIFQISFMPPIPVLIIVGIVLLLLCFMLCQEGGRLLKESEYSVSFIFFTNLSGYFFLFRSRISPKLLGPCIEVIHTCSVSSVHTSVWSSHCIRYIHCTYLHVYILYIYNIVGSWAGLPIPIPIPIT